MNQTTIKNSGIDVVTPASLSDFTTFRLGGNCPGLLECQTPDQLKRAIQFCNNENIRFILIGGGSNLLVSDDGIDCYVIRYYSETPVIKREGNELIVPASTVLDDLVKYTIEQSLEGLSHMSGIPGTVGGAVIGNAGAFGRQIGDVVKSVKIICRDRSRPVPTFDEIQSKNLSFSYRHSILKETKDIVVLVRLSLTPGDKKSLSNEREEILTLRKDKHPDLNVYPCAGSFFRNIEPTSKAGKREAAGWFLEQAGAMQLSSGGAKIFEHHANIIYKSPRCQAQDVFNLSIEMARAVKEKFGIDLVREVRFVGKFNGMPKNINDFIW